MATRPLSDGSGAPWAPEQTPALPTAAAASRTCLTRATLIQPTTGVGGPRLQLLQNHGPLARAILTEWGRDNMWTRQTEAPTGAGAVAWLLCCGLVAQPA
jgi:hypothetical protein